VTRQGLFPADLHTVTHWLQRVRHCISSQEPAYFGKVLFLMSPRLSLAANVKGEAI
jgi:hypothetical protein